MAITAERLVATLEADIRRFEKGMADAVTIMDRRASQIEKRQQTLAQRIEKNFSGSGRSLSTIGIGKFLGTAALLSFGKSVLDTASALSEQAQQVGVNVEAFQAYEAILRDSGASNQQAQQAIARLSEQLGEAKDGSKDAREAFMAFGISVDDLIKMSPEEAFQAVAKGALSIADASQRAAALTQVFGQRVARFLIPALAEIAKGADANIEAMKAQGRVMDEELLKRADVARDKLGAAWDKLVANAAPAVTASIEALSGLIGFGEFLGKKLADAIWGPAGENVKMSPEAQQRIFNALGGQSGMTGLKPGSAEVSNAEPFPDHIDVTPSVLQAGLRVMDAIKEFHTDAQAAEDDYDQREAEANQDIHDKRLQLIDDADQHEAEANQDIHDKRLELINDADQRDAEAAQDTTDKIKQLNDDYYQHQAEEQQQLADRISEINRGLVDDLAGLLVEGGNHWKDYARVAIRAIEQIIRAQEQFDRASGAQVGFGTFLRAFGLGSSSSAAPAGDIGDIGDIPGRASGGDVSAGRAYIVGEKRPELFVPSTSGRIIPRIPQIPSVEPRPSSVVMNFTNQNSFAGAIDAKSMQAYADQVGRVSANAAVSQIRKNFPALIAETSKRHF